MPQPRPSNPIDFSGRSFSIAELRLIQEVSTDCALLSVTELSRTISELLDWHRPNGKLKSHECRLLLEHLASLGLVSLPAVRQTRPQGPTGVEVGQGSEPEPEMTGWAGEFDPLELEVVRGRPGLRLWAELIERYHYLGYRVPVGANLRYFVHSGRCGKRVLACLLWTSPAWKIAVRDGWIGWNDQERRRNLQLVVNNARFLILPSVRVRSLASKILGLCARQLPGHWEEHYGYRPVLLETLVDSARFRGTCYRAANWVWLGQTRGRGRMDREHKAVGGSVKDLYVYPLCLQARERLRTDAAPMFRGSDQTEAW